MKKTLVCILVTILTTGCGATVEEMAAYYKSIETSNQIITDSMKYQALEHDRTSLEQLKAFTHAINLAAITPSGADDVAVAMAYGYAVAKPFEVVQPKLNDIKAPETTSDKVRAWTPLIGMAMPFLYPWIYNSSGGNQGTTISASGGGKVAMNSGNAGSYNSNEGGSQSISTNVTDSHVFADDCGDDCSDPGDFPEGPPLAECIANPPGGHAPGSGTPLMCAGCSCESFYAGSCDCTNVSF